jgi:bifunctional non-homologous end joining protein LigD
MDLSEYRRKRDFSKTLEPRGEVVEKPRKSVSLRFVVQKHAARRLHYDFRLEMNGVLKSWAIPRGPSLDPAEKRLAVHVEDHPLDYGEFEGVIPEGEYGAGTVLLWDRGTWVPLDPDPEAAYRKGLLRFTLQGEKLHGNWALVRMGGKAAGKRRENWLLIKERDEAAVPQSGEAVVADNPLSVVTGRSLDTIANDQDRVWHSNQSKSANESSAVPTKARRLASMPGARKAPMPDNPRPQLATLVEKAPEGYDWLHEIKYDGYRLLASIERGKVRLITRGGLDWTAKFPELAQRLGELPVDTALIDGELVRLEPYGTSSFAGLQDAISSGNTAALTFFAFDLLYRDGWDLTGAALEAQSDSCRDHSAKRSRHAALQRSSNRQGAGVLAPSMQLWARRNSLETSHRPYRPGRSGGWRKVKCRNREEFVALGITDPKDGRAGFGALLLGYYDPKGTLHYAGRVGTGFNSAQLVELRERLDDLVRAEPLVALPKGVSSKGVQWECAVARRRFPVGASPTRRIRSRRKQSEQSWR